MNNEPNCIVYWSDNDDPHKISLRYFRPGFAAVIGQAGGSRSECIMLIPTWEAFEQASA